MRWDGEWLGEWLGDWLNTLGSGPLAPKGRAAGPVQRRNGRLVDNRLTPIRAVDTVLAILQQAFAEHGRFNRNDPKGSPIWIADPESAVRGERSGRNCIYVERGTMTPRNLHLAQRADGSMSGPVHYTDEVECDILIHCETGSKLASEILAGTVYLILKSFKLQLLAEYDLMGLRVTATSVPVEYREAPGANWVATVSLQVTIQEHAILTETANTLNVISHDVTAPDPAFPDRP